MKKIFLMFLMVAGLLAFSGCATLNPYDRGLLVQHHVSNSLYQRMLHGEPLALEDVIELSRRQLPAGFIIHYLSSTRSAYHLSSGDVARLRKAGVSKEVVDYLLDTPALYAPRPYYYPYPPYYPYDPYYYGGSSVIVGGGYWHRHHW